MVKELWAVIYRNTCNFSYILKCREIAKIFPKHNLNQKK